MNHEKGVGDAETKRKTEANSGKKRHSVSVGAHEAGICAKARGSFVQNSQKPQRTE